MLRTPRSAAHLAARLAVVGALATTAACHDQRAPTAPPVSASAAVTAAAGNDGKVKIRRTQLSANKLYLDGPAVTASVTFGTTSTGFETGMRIRAEIAQPAAVRQAATMPVQCAPGDPPGSITGMNCEMTFGVRASNGEPGQGTLITGPAIFRFIVTRLSGETEIEVASKTVDVTLVASPTITSVGLTNVTLGIGGAPASYTATLQNPASTLQGVLLQGFIVQGTTRRAAGGVSVTCGSGVGVMPPGPCVVTFAAVASNPAGAIGTLVEGPAQFELNLMQTSGGTTTTFDTESVAITLVSLAPAIVSVELTSTTLIIGGASIQYTVQLRNRGPAISNVMIQGLVEQTTDDGDASRAAGGTTIDCGSGAGVLPTTGAGTCTFGFTATASNTLGGGGTLVPGLARFVLQLFEATADATTELDSRTTEVTLVAPTPTIVSVSPTSTFIVLGPGFTSYTATLDNPGATRTGVVVQTWIRQLNARRASGGTLIHCGGVGVGVGGELPPGSCTTPGDIVAGSGSDGAGTGTLVLGPATLEVELKVDDVVVDMVTLPIRLVAGTP